MVVALKRDRERCEEIDGIRSTRLAVAANVQLSQADHMLGPSSFPPALAERRAEEHVRVNGRRSRRRSDVTSRFGERDATLRRWLR